MRQRQDGHCHSDLSFIYHRTAHPRSYSYDSSITSPQDAVEHQHLHTRHKAASLDVSVLSSFTQFSSPSLQRCQVSVLGIWTITPNKATEQNTRVSGTLTYSFYSVLSTHLHASLWELHLPGNGITSPQRSFSVENVFFVTLNKTQTLAKNYIQRFRNTACVT